LFQIVTRLINCNTNKINCIIINLLGETLTQTKLENLRL